MKNIEKYNVQELKRKDAVKIDGGIVPITTPIIIIGGLIWLFSKKNKKGSDRPKGSGGGGTYIPQSSQTKIK